MDMLQTLFDYQRFARNPRLEAQLDGVYARYLAGGTVLDDEALELAAAGEPQPHKSDKRTNDAPDRSDG